MSDRKAILNIEGLTVELGGSVPLMDLSLTVREGDFLAIIGPNGSGKTTLLRCILGLTKPTRGTIELFGAPPEAGRKKVGYLPQHFDFDPSFPIDVFTAVMMSRYHGFLSSQTEADTRAVEGALKAVGMTDFTRRQMGTLSGGETQRVLLARALAREPELLLLDEPTASVDPDMQYAFYELLDELRERMVIMLVTHDVGVVFTHVDEVACLNRRLFYHGPTEGAGKVIEEMYSCPIELVAHGVPHRVLDDHE